MIKFQGADGRDRLWGYSNSTPVMKRLEESYRFALTAREQIATHRAHLGSTGKYTPQGIATEIHRYARENMLPGLGRARLAVQQAKRQLAERRQRIKPAAPDKQDVVGFFRRESIRDQLRSLSRDMRDNYLSRHAADLDPEVAAAVLESVDDLPWTSPEKRFVSEATRAKLLRSVVAPEHRAELAELDEVEQALELTNRVVENGRDKIRTELGLSPVEFDKLATPIEQAEAKKSPPPWLKRFGDKISVVFPRKSDLTGADEFGSRPATPQEIEAGIFASSLAEYQARAAA
jgi:hypothetical protein